MVCPITYGDHKKARIYTRQTATNYAGARLTSNVILRLGGPGIWAAQLCRNNTLSYCYSSENVKLQLLSNTSH